MGRVTRFELVGELPRKVSVFGNYTAADLEHLPSIGLIFRNAANPSLASLTVVTPATNNAL
jgi:hypothetical protein